MAGVLDALKAQYEAIIKQEREAQEKVRGDTLAVERVKLEKEARAKDAPPAERLFNDRDPTMADRLRHPENERSKPAREAQQGHEKPVNMEYKPTGLQQGPSIEIPGGARRYGNAERPTAEAEPQPDKLTITTTHQQGFSSSKPLPHERFAAEVDKAPRQTLFEEIRARREAQAEIERTRDPLKRLMPDLDRER